MDLLARPQSYLAFDGLSAGCLKPLPGLDHHADLVGLVVVNNQDLVVGTLLEVSGLQPQVIRCHSRVYFPRVGLLFHQQLPVIDLHEEVDGDLDQSRTGR